MRVDASRGDGSGVDGIGASGVELVGGGATVQREDPLAVVAWATVPVCRFAAVWAPCRGETYGSLA
ncbi:hypothetical protein GBQ13_00135 [Mycobacterium avium subsp. hominissuis]|nr:hypothetical protein [Mycobacterium avium subsp. hominissuis]